MCLIYRSNEEENNHFEPSIVLLAQFQLLHGSSARSAWLRNCMNALNGIL